jgi:anti-sigma regulatory factor (Ser/Thr protein kinase)
MTTREKIFCLVSELTPVGSSALVRRIGLSRKTVARHLKLLVESGRLIRTGSTRNARYRPAAKGTRPVERRIVLHKVLRGADEHRVHTEIDLKLSLRRTLGDRARAIAEYAFTEMFNNAIDHSGSRNARVTVQLKRGSFEFWVRDFGVGLFANVRTKFGLADEYEAVDHVLKGRQTTLPDRHTGEGLFFTSRIADRFEIRSHRLLLSIENDRSDCRLAERRFLRGTEVYFSIRQRSRKSLKQLFDRYANETFEFKRGEIRVRLSEQTGNVSRSQARRLCHGLERFDRVVFDFTGVGGIGQGFADEIFRVFANAHPEIEVSFSNAARPVEFMVLRAIRGRTESPGRRRP